MQNKKQTNIGPLRVIQGPDDLTLEIDWRNQQAPNRLLQTSVVLAGWLAVTGGLSVVLFLGGGQLFAGVFVLLLFLVGLAMAYDTLARWLNFTVITLTPDVIHAQTRPLPAGVLGAHNFKKPAQQIEQIVVESYFTGADDTGAQEYVYAVRALFADGSEHMLFTFYSDPETAARVEQRIEDFLGIVNDPSAQSEGYRKARGFVKNVTGLEVDPKTGRISPPDEN